jgi:hypothetical protein
MNTIEIQAFKIKKKQSANKIMNDLENYIKRHNLEGFEVIGHKFRTPIYEFYLGHTHKATLYIQAHLRYILNTPRYWQFEFKMEGKKSHLTLHDFTVYKLSKKCKYQSREDDFQVLKTEERVDFLIRKLERLRTMYIESSTDRLKRWFDDKHPERMNENPFIGEYRRNTRGVSPKSKRYITLF